MRNPESPLRWGVLSTGRIAGVFAKGVAASRSGRVVAVGSRTAASAARFAGEHGIASARAHASYGAFLADPDVEAVYIATPHPGHVEWAVKAAEAGKHVLCEKPAGMNLAEGRRMIEAARRAGVLFMEAFMYRCHPQTVKLAELVRGGVVGEVKFVQASFGFRSDYDPSSRLWNKALGGGAILDVGCYPVSFARLIAGAAAGGSAGGAVFADPTEVSGAVAEIHPEGGADAFAAATLRFAGGMVAQVACAVGLTIDNRARIHGTEGWIEVPHPWIITKSGGEDSLFVHRRGAARPERIPIAATDVYALEAEAFAEAVRAGARAVPAMSPEDTLGNLATLDRWRAAVGLRYPADEAAG
jgi:predicted dehydrogenase